MVEIRILADNTVASIRPTGLRAEWGFAAAVDDVLLDTGQTGVARENARLLGLVEPFETIVLSHGHFDHTGGLPAFLEGEPSVYLHPEAWKPRYKNGAFTGIPYARDRIDADARIVEHTEPVEVADGIVALGEIPRPHPDNPSGVSPVDGSHATDQIVDDQALAVRTDEIVDDQSLAVRTDDGVALVLGCCHAGLRNTIEYAETVCEDRVTAVVGGTHLASMDREDVTDLARWLADELDFIAPAHCTGFEAQATLREAFGDRFRSVGVGSTVDL